MKPCATPKTSPRWCKQSLLREKVGAAQRKHHCASMVTSHESVHETAEAVSRPSENTAREGKQDYEHNEQQENAGSGEDVAHCGHRHIIDSNSA